MDQMTTDPLPVYFEIPAQDAMGFQHVTGKLDAQDDKVLLYWKIKDRTFKKTSDEMAVIELSYLDIESLTHKKSWFSGHQLILKVRDPRLIENIPGVNMGTGVLQLPKKSRTEVPKLIKLVDYKISEIQADEILKRMDEQLNRQSENEE